MISVHGSKVKYQHEILGVNSRLTSSSGHLETKPGTWNLGSIQDTGAQRYNLAWQGLDVVTPCCRADVRHVYNQYSIRTGRRDSLATFLKARGIGHAIHYPTPLHLQPAFRQLADPKVALPVAETVCKEIISLPIFPEMEEPEIQL
jgi:dTDP-4-amino-4,6-dideoxygalactose transaminase